MKHLGLAFWIWAALPGSAIIGTGCSGPDIPELRVPVEQRHALRGPSEAPLNLPEDRPFAIHVKKGSQEPGPDGKAEGISDATPAGEGMCAAKASNGGMAGAEFTLGHRIDNQGGVAQTVTLQVEFDLKTQVTASSQPAPLTSSAANLDLLVIDGGRQVVARVPMLQGASDAGAAEGASHEQRNLRLRFDAGHSYDVVLAGKAMAKSAVGQEAQARLNTGNLKMRLTFAPAATQPAAEAVR
jgi:hypothetical protein